MKSTNYLDREQRAALVRSTFDAHIDILFVTSKAEHASDLSIPPEIDNELRGQFRQFMEQHWPEWQESAARYSDDRLYGFLEEYQGKLNSPGILQWQEGKALKPSILETLRKEIATDTKAAQSQPERLTRRRAEKLLGPMQQVPKQMRGKVRGKGIDLER